MAQLNSTRKVFLLWYDDFNNRASHTHFIVVYSSRRNCLNFLFEVVKFYRSLHCFKMLSAIKDNYTFSYEDKLLGTTTIHLHITETPYNKFIFNVI